MSEYAERIREVREAAKMSQGDMAFELGVSTSGYANLEQGRRKVSIEHVKAVNEAVAPIIGDKLMYLFTGKMQAEYLIDHSIDDSYIDRACALRKLEEWLVDMKIKNIIRFKGSSTELTSLFSKTLKSNPKNIPKSQTA